MGEGLLQQSLTVGGAYAFARNELLLFAATFFLIGALDELIVDLTYLWMRMTGRAKTKRIDANGFVGAPLSGHCAVFIPAWQESAVIGITMRHALEVWPQRGWRLFVGCYPNDPETIAVATEAAGDDDRVRIVIHDREGPTCKADCLNALYRALQADEAAGEGHTRMVVLHDAEDLVDPAALPVLDQAMDAADFVQLPVMALPQRGSPLVAGHYSDEFAEAHARSMVVRSALDRGIPGAGVGCAIARDWLERLDTARAGAGPFAAGALTEDYELGLQVAAMGARSRFLRLRTREGRLVATRAYFPASMSAAIRQKSRWIHGIAFQGWDRLGWHGSPAALWMQLRDRRGPLAALLLATAYALVVLEGLHFALGYLGMSVPSPLSPGLTTLLWINAAVLAWRLSLRALFTTREYGLAQGLLAIPRVIVSNTVAIVSARHALAAYVRRLAGGAETAWDKTEHALHPALSAEPVRTRPS